MRITSDSAFDSREKEILPNFNVLVYRRPVFVLFTVSENASLTFIINLSLLEGVYGP